MCICFVLCLFYCNDWMNVLMYELIILCVDGCKLNKLMMLEFMNWKSLEDDLTC